MAELDYIYSDKQIYKAQFTMEAMNRMKMTRNGNWTLAALILCYAFTILSPVIYAVNFSNVIYPMLTFFVLYCIFEKKIKLEGPHIAIIFFWLAAVLSTLISPLVQPKWNLITWGVFTIYFILGANLRFDMKEKRILSTAIILLSVIVALSIVSDYVLNFSIRSRYSFVWRGAVRDQNYPAASMQLGIVLLMLRVIGESKKRIINTIALAIVLYSVLLTGSRSGIICSTIIALLLLIFYKNEHQIRTHKIFIKLIMASIFLITVIYIDKLLPEYVYYRVFQGAYGDDPRMPLWTTLLTYFPGRPIIGYGVGASHYILRNIAHFGFTTHNVFLTMLIDIGIIGVAFYVSAYCLMISKSANRFVMLVAVFAVCFPMLFIDGMNTAQFWNALIFPYALFRKTDECHEP